MLTNTKLVNAVAIPVAILVILASVLYTYLHKVKKEQYEAWKKKNINNRYIRYYTSIFTRRRFRRIFMQFASMDCYEEEVVREESVKTFESAMLICIALPIIAIFVFRNILLGLLTVLISMVYYEMSVEQRLDKIYKSVIEDLSACIQSIRENYMISGDIAGAVASCTRSGYLEIPIGKIHRMLTSTEREDELNLFCQTSPIRLLRTLATVCFITIEWGDARDTKGNSSFANTLTSLRLEADMEIRRLKRTKIAFKSLPVIALLGVVIAPIVEIFLTSEIPGTIALLKGMYGYVEKTVIILVTTAAYYIISMYSKATVVNTVDKVQWIDTLSKKEKMNKFLKNIEPKKLKVRNKLKKLLQGSISAKSIDYIYMSKVVYSFGIAIITFIMIILAMLMTKSMLWNSYKSFGVSNNVGELKEAAVRRLKEVDMSYMREKTIPDSGDVLTTLNKRVPELSDLEAQNEAYRIVQKWTKYYKVGFRWYFVLIAAFAGCIGWFVPEISLMLRKSMVEAEELQDVMQLQTMMMTLSTTTMDVGEVLYWLAKQSTIHKLQLFYAVQGYPSGQEDTIDRLSYSVHASELKRLCSKLKAAVHAQPLDEAFSDIALDKEQLMYLREMNQNEVIDSRKQTASLVSMAPVILAIVAGFVLPILIMGLNELFMSMGSASAIG